MEKRKQHYDEGAKLRAIMRYSIKITNTQIKRRNLNTDDGDEGGEENRPQKEALSERDEYKK